MLDLDSNAVFTAGLAQAPSWQSLLPTKLGKQMRARLVRAAKQGNVECGAGTERPHARALPLQRTSVTMVRVCLPPYRAGTASDMDFLFRNPEMDYSSIDLVERMVRDAALRFMVELLAGYAMRWFVCVCVPRRRCHAHAPLC